MDDPGYSAMDDARVWLRTHWQLIAAPVLTLAIIAAASMWLRPKAQPSGPVSVDNPAGVVDGQPYEPNIDPAEFSTTVDNPFYPLIAGTTGTFREGNERVVVTVTASTRTVMGVETVVVRDQEFDGDRLIEDTEDWFAQDGEDNVWYFGESTAECRDGEVTSQAGSWEAGVDGAQPGIVMLGKPDVGDYYRQEYYRGHAEDVARVREVGATMTVGDTTYRNVVVTEDFTPLEPGALEHKGYAPEVGLIREGPPGGGGVHLTETAETAPMTSDPTTMCKALQSDGLISPFDAVRKVLPGVESMGQRAGRMAARRRSGRPVPPVVRKVRAPQRRVAGNTRPSRDEDQCHSDDAVADPWAGRRSETGKLHPEQGQIGGRNPCRATGRGRGALPSPRVGRMSRRATDGPRWMAITERGASAARDRTRLTGRPR